jgi:hypothetical protein
VGSAALFAEQVTEAEDRVRAVLDELLFRAAADVLQSTISAVYRGRSARRTHSLVAVEGDGACDLALAVLVRDALGEALLRVDQTRRT